jgi:hypothetical protein
MFPSPPPTNVVPLTTTPPSLSLSLKNATWDCFLQESEEAGNVKMAVRLHWVPRLAMPPLPHTSLRCVACVSKLGDNFTEADTCLSIEHLLAHVSRFIQHILCFAELSFLSQSHVTLMLASYREQKQTKLHGLSPRANYTDRATAASRRSGCQLLRIEGATWSAWRIPTAVFSIF